MPVQALLQRATLSAAVSKECGRLQFMYKCAERRLLVCCLACVQILLHPKWGSAVYPATMFTTAPLDLLKAAIDAASSH